MLIEYYLNNIDDKEIDIKNNIETVIQYPISSILGTIHHIKYIKKNCSLSSQIQLGCFVDYPLASSDIERRQDLIVDAINIGINFVSVTMPYFTVVNRKYAKFRDDIKKNIALCNNHNIQLRYILEYRKFDHQLLIKVCEILLECGVNIVYPSTGLFLDNIDDNIIACAYLNNKTGINTIVNGNVWKKDQIEHIKKISPIGFSTNKIESIKLNYV